MEAFGEGAATICRLYGVSPLLGRLFVLLFSSPRPLSLGELVERSGAAKSTLSVALRKLLATRVVRRLPPGSDRQDYYAPVEDPWEMVADWARLFFRPELEVWRRSAKQLREALQAKDAPAREGRQALLERVDRFDDLMAAVQRLLDALPGATPRPPQSRAVPIELGDDPEDRP